MKQILKYPDSRSLLRAKFVGVPRPSVALVEDSGRVEFIGADQTVAGDVCYVRDGMVCYIPYPQFRPSMGTAIGIVVIPSSHRADGKTIIMSLCNMSLQDPENGSLDEKPVDGDNYMMWGEYNVDTPLSDNDQVPIIDLEDGASVGTSSWGYSSIEYPFKTKSLDGIGSYYVENNCMPSPYLYDGSKNMLFRTAGSIFSTEDGRYNTDVIRQLIEDNGYLNDGEVENVQQAYPAANCCLRFRTEHTEQGDWYLPSIWELCYLSARLSTINNALAAAGGVKVGDMKTSEQLGFWLWSSSEYSRYSAWGLYTDDGYVDDNYKYYVNSGNRVRAFCAL